MNLITTNQYLCSSHSVSVEKLTFKNILGDGWNLYEIKANELSGDAAKFFLDYHCRLTADPISIQPIYPTCTQDDDIICCDSQKIFFCFSGNAKIRIFPQANSSLLFEEKNFKLVETVPSNNRRMIVAGRSQILRCLHL